MILQHLFGRKANSTAAVYDAIVASARQPKFYADMGVPDTLDGRFDMIVLHLFLVLDRMKGKDEKGAAYDRKIRYIDTWIKRDGHWLALASAGANIKE